MKRASTRKAVRAGFTLVEIVVVLAILLILVGLTTAAVLKFLRTGKVTKNRVTISQLEAGLANAKTYFKLREEFPSRLVLCQTYGEYVSPQNVNKLHYAFSLAFLQRMFPRLWRTPAAQAIPQNWDNNGMQGGPIVLDGDQCLVFFLGGIPSAPGQTPACLGFSSIGTNPADTSSPTRIGPFYDFPSDKLVRIHQNLFGSLFFSYLDVYGTSDGNGKRLSGQPYLYFSSYGQRNGYAKFLNVYSTPSPDCYYIDSVKYPDGVWPYQESLGNYLNPSTFQIISAGEDGDFAVGTDLATKNPYFWDRGAADLIPAAGKDDQSNFSGPPLGTPQ
jgi:prepilin-type N-terminal cleavage/methylation domain-containing protein